MLGLRSCAAMEGFGHTPLMVPSFRGVQREATGKSSMFGLVGHLGCPFFGDPPKKKERERVCSFWFPFKTNRTGVASTERTHPNRAMPSGLSDMPSGRLQLFPRIGDSALRYLVETNRACHSKGRSLFVLLSPFEKTLNFPGRLA